jgi:hypothetical protein
LLKQETGEEAATLARRFAFVSWRQDFHLAVISPQTGKMEILPPRTAVTKP